MDKNRNGNQVYWARLLINLKANAPNEFKQSTQILPGKADFMTTLCVMKNH